MHIYWLAVFELPADTMAQVEKICRRFSWGGLDNIKKRNPVGWDQVCRPKDGGLGIRRVNDWNQAAISYHCFQLASNKSSLWANWVHAKYFRNANFWKLKTPEKCSWAWPNIMLVRDQMKVNVFYSIGNGLTTNFFHDPWLPKGSLIDQFGMGIINNIGLGDNIVVANFIENGKWKDYPLQNTRRAGLAFNLRAAWTQIEDQKIAEHDHDEVVWKANPSGKFSVKSAWNQFRYHHQK